MIRLRRCIWQGVALAVCCIATAAAAASEANLIAACFFSALGGFSLGVACVAWRIWLVVSHGERDAR